MAESTAYVLAAGGIVFADRVINDKRADVVVAIATGAAALATAGLDKAMPGAGKGLAVLMVLGALLTSGVRLVGALPKGKPATAAGLGLGVGGRFK